MHRAHTADTRPATIFIHNDAPQALLDCHENRMASVSLMHRAHTADTRPATIFTHNGAPAGAGWLQPSSSRGSHGVCIFGREPIFTIRRALLSQ